MSLEPAQDHNTAKRAKDLAAPAERPLETERRLRQMLQGKRLVGELDLSPDGSAYEMAEQVYSRVNASGNFWAGRYSASVVVFLVANGARCYDDGTFWPNIEGLGASGGLDRSKFGQAFEAAVRELELEDFSETLQADKWLRYVTPILLHGGIPANCAGVAAQLVLSDLQQGVHDGAELVEGILGSPTRRAQLDKPLERFFVFGGEFALDIVERMITAVFDINTIGRDDAQQLVPELARDLGLPEYLLHALIAGEPMGNTVRRRRPRPTVRIDRFSCAGPYVTFPPVPDTGVWLLSDRSTTRYTASRHDERDVALVPSPRGWTTALRTDSSETRTRFSGHPNAAAYIFGPDGVLARDQERIRGDVALLLVADGITVVRSDGTPVTLAEELPFRAEPWAGWCLLSLDLSRTDALVLSDVSGPTHVRLRVVRAAQSPAITGQPVAAVTGPAGCTVYADVPCVTEPQGSAPSTWRVRWRDDNDTTPPATAVLADLPRTDQGRSLASRLPDRLSCSGVLEVAGPLGSDMRQRLAVVRGLRLTVPDRVFGPDETVEVAVDAACVIACPDGSAGRSVTVCFGPGVDRVELSADGMPFTVTIPRLSWATSFRGEPAPALGRDCQQIGFDQIETGEAASLLVRCGRPAKVALELHGQGLVQREEEHAGELGRWAFPLSLFRDSVAVSGLASMPLRLAVDGLCVNVARVAARHEVSNLMVDVVDTDGCDNLVGVTWDENRRFRNRQVRLWSQHRIWEPPICEDVPDDSDGVAACVFEAPPGPYLLEVAVSDDWVAPQRPAPGSGPVEEVAIGSVQDAQRHRRSLRHTVAREALELAVAGDPRASQLTADTLSAARSELRDALAVSSGPAVPFETLTRLVRLAVLPESMLGEMLTEDLIGALPDSHVFKLAMALMTVPSRSVVPPGRVEALWESEPLVAAVVDCGHTAHSASRWVHFAGWAPGTGTDGIGQPPEPVSSPLDELPPDRLTAIADALPPTGSLPLEFGGYRAAALEMLAKTWQNREQLNDWMSAHARTTTYTQRLSQEQRRQGASLEPDSRTPGWFKFPARLQTAAFQLTDEFSDQTELDAAARALLDAAELAPLLTRRCVFTAAVLRAAPRT